MVEFEKVEKLVQKTNVSYEDAKIALENANGDMLDAIIALEKQGKVNGPQQATYTTGPEATQYRDVPAAVAQTNNKTEGKNFFKDLGAAIKRGFQYTVDNSVRVIKKDQEIIKLPLWLTIIMLLAAWELIIIVVIVSLFFDCRYALVGKDDTNQVNKVMNQATDFAGKVKDSWNESFNNSSTTPETSPYNNAEAEVTVEPVVEPTVEPVVDLSKDGTDAQ